MNQQATNLRQANPNLDDGLAFAKYVDIASEGFFSFMLGPRAEQIIAEAFVRPEHELSYQHVTFVSQDDTIVGMYLGYTAEQHREASKEPLKRAAGRRNIRMKIVSILFAPLMRITDNMPDGDFYLQFIAVDKSVRGGGVGSVLMDAFEEQARLSGSTRISLDVSSGNGLALEFYKRRGMTIESQWPKRIPLPGLKFYRMVKIL
ncbi:MAG: GNAT family N-acetyltransferase [Pseudomonadales bacterium]|nr:GNAT family N-acetyltransferase [Pseudomonadales bacterium]